MINALNVTNIMFRLPLYSFNNVRNVSTCIYPLCFRATEILLAEPLKKKKRLDPAIIRAREDRKKKKLEKRIRRLEKRSGQLKPLDEMEGLAELANEKNKRLRHLTPLSAEEVRNRTLLEREWGKYRKDEWQKDLQIIKSIMLSQEKALKELKAASRDLYNKAVEFNDQYLPYNAVGPLYTPPIPDYYSPDGEYTETTVKYVGET